jgi:2-keto-4-pentenoate hydratase
MDETAIQSCAEFLARARLGGPPTAAPPKHLSPENERDGYEIQETLHETLASAGFGRLSGHKIGCTTPVMQEFLKIDHPCAGRVFSSMEFQERIKLPLARFHHIGVECEIAARLGVDMPGTIGPYTQESASDAVSALMGAIELVDDRYENYPALSAPMLIADDFFNAGVVLGREVPDWRALDLARVRGTLFIDGVVHSTGFGEDILGHPMEALAWLANHRASIGQPLRAGDFVMLGSVVKTVFFDAPAEVMVDLEGLSRAEIQFI